MTGPEGRGDRLLAGHADRERVIQALKDAFVLGRLDRVEFGARAGGALTARTYAELAALTADIPAGRPAMVHESLLERRPVTWALIGFSSCMAVAFGLMLFAAIVLDRAGAGNPAHSLSTLCGLGAFVALISGLGVLIHGLGTAEHQRRVRRQPPSA